ncbi:uncharacterized protein LOC143030990 isoform X2 [Oratosquilla oratoria]|uniref:uncharacterized protein LOC143030990 isoform X2 n=1 Tax=Oratosquilla oratoria TaxID=337810 RepID=UPI003F764AF3
MHHVMECSVCLHLLGKDRRPHVLPCGHNFCLSCLAQVFHVGVVACPTCRRMHPYTSIQDIPVNYGWEALFACVSAAKDFRDSVKSRRTKDSGHKGFCGGVCPDHDCRLSFWCTSCRVAICGECAVLKHPPGHHKLLHMRHALDQRKAEYVDQNKAVRNLLAEAENNIRQMFDDAPKEKLPVMAETASRLALFRRREEEQEQDIEAETDIVNLEEKVYHALQESRIGKLAVLQQVKKVQGLNKSVDLWIQTMENMNLAGDLKTDNENQESPVAFDRLDQSTTTTATATMAAAKPQRLFDGHTVVLSVPDDVTTPYTVNLVFKSPSNGGFRIDCRSSCGVRLLNVYACLPLRYTAVWARRASTGTEGLPTRIAHFPFQAQRTCCLDVVEEQEKYLVYVDGQLLAERFKGLIDGRAERCSSVEVTGWAVDGCYGGIDLQCLQLTRSYAVGPTDR